MRTDGDVVIGAKLDTKSFDVQIEQVENQLLELEDMLAKPKEYELSNTEIEKLQIDAEKLKNKLIDLRKKKEQLDKKGLTNIEKSLSKINNSMGKAITKVGRWALAIFGIRSMYMLVRQAVSTLASEDDQIATDLEYMRWILAQTLKPIVDWLISALYTILALINSISVEIFDFNILAGKSAEDFKKSKQNIGGMSDELKEAKKQLAGFDEMNVLQEPTKATGGGGTTLADWEPPDLNKYGNQVKEIQSEWEKFGSEMKQTLDETPLIVWFKAFGNLGLAVRGATQAVHGLWLVVDGVKNYIKNALKFIKALIEGDTEEAKQALIGMFLSSNEILRGTIEFAFGLIQGALGLLLALVTKVGEFVWNILTDTANDIVERFNGAVDKIKDVFKGIYTFFKTIADKILGLFGGFGTKVGEVVGGAFKSVVNAVLNSIEKTLNGPIRTVNSLITEINKLPLGVKLHKLTTFNIPRLAKGGIINMPGRGVPVGAIGGESGKEGIVPLTDSQQMALLGEAIGKYININATVPVYVGNRQIAREIKKIQAENDFAYNR